MTNERRDEGGTSSVDCFARATRIFIDYQSVDVVVDASAGALRDESTDASRRVRWRHVIIFLLPLMFFILAAAST